MRIFVSTETVVENEDVVIIFMRKSVAVKLSSVAGLHPSKDISVEAFSDIQRSLGRD